jgi:hypothetical protein
MDKNTVGLSIGKAPVTMANDSFFSAVAEGFSSDIVHNKHKRAQLEGRIASYEKLGYTNEEAVAITEGG